MDSNQWLGTWRAGAVALAASIAPAIPLRLLAWQFVDETRNMWLYGLAWLLTARLAAAEPFLGAFLAGAIWHWRSYRNLPAVAIAGAAAACWLLISEVPTVYLTAIPYGWRAIALAQIAIGVAQRWQGFEVKGVMGTRTMLAAFLALVLPFASPWEWPAYAVGLYLASSGFAIIACAASVVLLYPAMWSQVLVMLLAGAAVMASQWTRRKFLDRTPRGSSRDSLRMRWATDCALVRLYFRWPIWLVGRGPNASGNMQCTERDLEEESVRLKRPLNTSPCHCEPLEFAYTYGLFAVAAMVLFAIRIAPHMRIGDPWSACMLSGVVLSLASSPFRVAPVGLTWWVAAAALGARA